MIEAVDPEVLSFLYRIPGSVFLQDSARAYIKAFFLNVKAFFRAWHIWLLPSKLLICEPSVKVLSKTLFLYTWHKLYA